MKKFQALIFKLQAETGGSHPTITKWLRDDESVSRVHQYAFEQAVKRLRLQDEIDEARAELNAPAATGTEG